MCCTFVYSLINLIWNKQYVFFILVVSDFKRTPLRDQVWQEVNKQYHGLTTLRKHNHYYDTTFWKNGGVQKYDGKWIKSFTAWQHSKETATTTLPFEKTEECESTMKNGELQEQEFVFLL